MALIQLQMLLKSQRQLLLDILTRQVTVDAVTIIDRKEVQAELPKHIRLQHIRILIHLFRVSRLEADRGGVRELRDAVEALARHLHGFLGAHAGKRGVLAVVRDGGAARLRGLASVFRLRLLCLVVMVHLLLRLLQR